MVRARGLQWPFSWLPLNIQPEDFSTEILYPEMLYEKLTRYATIQPCATDTQRR